MKRVTEARSRLECVNQVLADTKCDSYWELKGKAETIRDWSATARLLTEGRETSFVLLNALKHSKFSFCEESRLDTFCTRVLLFGEADESEVKPTATTAIALLIVVGGGAYVLLFMHHFVRRPTPSSTRC